MFNIIYHLALLDYPIFDIIHPMELLDSALHTMIIAGNDTCSLYGYVHICHHCYVIIYF